MQADYREFLKPEAISKLTSINLQARFIVEGFLTGLHKSPYHGFSVEFSEYRQYSMGDEPKRIDWKVFARTGKYYIKRFEQETNLRAYIFLDISKSMHYRSDTKLITKAEYAAYLAASLMLLLLKQRDAVGLVTFHSKTETTLLPSLRESHQTEMLKIIAQSMTNTQTNAERKTNFSNALIPFIRQMHPRSLSIIISDCWENPENAIPTLKLFRHKQNEAIVFHILDPREKDLDLHGNARKEFIDLETGAKLSTSHAQIKKAYTDAFIKHTEAYNQGLKNSGIDYVQIETKTPFDMALLAYFKKRQRMKR